MQFICLQENLAKGLQIAKQSGVQKTTLPILQNFLITQEQGMLMVTSTNLDIGIKAYIRGKEEGDTDIESQSVTIPQDKLFSYVKNLPQNKTYLTLSEHHLRVESGQDFSADFQGISAEEFPELPEVEEGYSLTLDSQELKHALKRASVSLPKNDYRPEIAGVYIAKKDQELVITGTDGFRLSETKLQIPSIDSDDFQFTIPQKTIAECIRILDIVDDEEVSLLFSQDRLKIQLGHVEITSTLVEGKFPQYEALIPQSFIRELLLDKKTLVQAIKLSSVFTTDSVNDVKIQGVNDTHIALSSSHDEIGNNKSQVPTDMTGDNQFEITFNYTYLLDGIQSCQSEEITLSLNDADSPAILRGKDDDQFLYLVMPIRD